ncbi:hypothetical protein HPP92_010814 [Vanilla planifolia]|uniref:Uncharacterized protein n=1 Tax=Vanilla planifolia TaxID=51239 RepID=A0A835QZB9_VANPL|nr:hypothetical protein HPP92_010814 [Vanilla planifolia]
MAKVVVGTTSFAMFLEMMMVGAFIVVCGLGNLTVTTIFLLEMFDGGIWAGRERVIRTRVRILALGVISSVPEVGLGEWLLDQSLSSSTRCSKL